MPSETGLPRGAREFSTRHSTEWRLAGTGALDDKAWVDTAPGTDTSCGALGWGNLFVDVEGDLRRGLNSQSVLDSIKKALAGAQEIQTAELFGPFCLELSPLSGSPKACLYPAPMAIWAGPLSGAISAARIDFHYRGFPSIVLDSVQATVKPSPLTLEHGGPPPNPEVQVYFPVAVSYSV